MSTSSKNPSLVAAADLTGKEYRFGKLSGGKVAVCSVLGERADVVIGGNPPAAADLAVETSTQVGEAVLIKVGAAPVLINAELTTDADALAITAVSTNIVFAKALEAGAAGQIIRALTVSAYAKP